MPIYNPTKCQNCNKIVLALFIPYENLYICVNCKSEINLNDFVKVDNRKYKKIYNFANF